MKHGYVDHPFLNLLAGIVLVLLVMALASCGTLDVSLGQTPEPTLVTLAAVTDAAQSSGTETSQPPEKTGEPTAGWGPLTAYTHPLFGYEILIPEGATILEGEPGDNITSFTDRSPSGDSPSYLISVRLLPAIDQSPQELVVTLSAGESGVSAVESVEMGTGVETTAMVSYSFGAGAACPEMRPLLAAMVNRGTGYAIRVFSDLPEGCDAADVPEALAIVKSFRPAADAPVLAMTPTPTPAPVDDLVVVYTRDNNAWLWTEAGGQRQLTKDGGVEQVFLSDDKRLIAFRRGNGIWAVNADGSDERQLVKESDLPIPQEGELAEFITGMTPHQLAWIPGSHQLLFNTAPELTGPGLLLSDDLWWVDADKLSLKNLFAAGEGGNFAIAPDGRQVALVTPESISLATINGDEKRQIMSYTRVSTYSEFQYYARPVWSPGGDALGVVIPPPDPAASQTQAYGIWHLHTDGTPARLAGTLETRGTLPLLEPVIAPNLDTIAYLSSPEDDSGRTDLLFVTWGDILGDPFFYTSRVASFDTWSPGGQRFSFSRSPSEIASVDAFTGRMDEEPRPVGNGESVAIDVHWVDDDRYLYLQASAKGWDLLLTDSSGMVTSIAAVVGRPPAFDAGR